MTKEPTKTEKKRPAIVDVVREATPLGLLSLWLSKVVRTFHHKRATKWTPLKTSRLSCQPTLAWGFERYSVDQNLLSCLIIWFTPFEAA